MRSRHTWEASKDEGRSRHFPDAERIKRRRIGSYLVAGEDFVVTGRDEVRLWTGMRVR